MWRVRMRRSARGGSHPALLLLLRVHAELELAVHRLIVHVASAPGGAPIPYIIASKDTGGGACCPEPRNNPSTGDTPAACVKSAKTGGDDVVGKRDDTRVSDAAMPMPSAERREHSESRSGLAGRGPRARSRRASIPALARKKLLKSAVGRTRVLFDVNSGRRARVPAGAYSAYSRRMPAGVEVSTPAAHCSSLRFSVARLAVDGEQRARSGFRVVFKR